MNQLPFFYQLLSNIYFLHALMSQLTTLFHYSTSSGAVLLACKSSAFGVQEQCFWRARAMLLACKSNAFRTLEQCFWHVG